MKCPKCKNNMSYQKQFLFDGSGYITGQWYCICGKIEYDTFTPFTMSQEREEQALSEKSGYGKRRFV
jgi:hypothetical protein